ncbi:tumor necrosis factor ligand superfamily member 10-like [Ptychodera flava]|uniref:tumor necrosis factor ligand superfamily member 10-like n=1 Tax=Ptychodera flava TaxID=63121 RepID=UPI00396A2CBF
MADEAQRGGKVVSRTVMFSCLQMIITIVIFSLVIAILWLHFQSELSKLKQSTGNLDNSQASGDQSNLTLTSGCNSRPCNCSNPDIDSETTGGHGGVNADDRNIKDGATSQNLLNCCSTNQETVEQLIAKALEDERRLLEQARLEIQQSTRGEIERQIQRLRNNNRTQEQTSLGSRSSIPVAVHVTRQIREIRDTVICPAGQQIEGSLIKVGPWEPSNGLAFSENVNMASDGYHLIVPKSGLYFVYSQVYFVYEHDEKETGRSNTDNELVHRTSRVAGKTDKDLMKSVRIGEGEVTNVSSFHSGLFKLQEGNKIYMKVYLPSNEVTVKCEDESTFMGMYMVNDDL